MSVPNCAYHGPNETHKTTDIKIAFVDFVVVLERWRGEGAAPPPNEHTERKVAWKRV